MKPLTNVNSEVLELNEEGESIGHLFERSAQQAINTAIYAGRPLLVRGEPGIGKSQLARAAAIKLKVPLVTRVLHARTETEELFWSLDAVARLGEAQVLGALAARPNSTIDIEKRLAVENFVTPGPLWWAFNWKGALELIQGREQMEALKPPHPADWQPSAGCVVLLDEIDKCDSAVPNGLLEALGQGRFNDPRGRVVAAQHGLPLVIISTNEERALPDAFLRRCVVLPLRLKDDNDDSLTADLVLRGRVHFKGRASESLLTAAARLLVQDRQEYKRQELSPPGQAEYLDLIRAILCQTSDPAAQQELMAEIAQYVFKKHWAP